MRVLTCFVGLTVGLAGFVSAAPSEASDFIEEAMKFAGQYKLISCDEEKSMAPEVLKIDVEEEFDQNQKPVASFSLLSESVFYKTDFMITRFGREKYQEKMPSDNWNGCWKRNVAIDFKASQLSYASTNQHYTLCAIPNGKTKTTKRFTFELVDDKTLELGNYFKDSAGDETEVVCTYSRTSK